MATLEQLNRHRMLANVRSIVAKTLENVQNKPFNTELPTTDQWQSLLTEALSPYMNQIVLARNARGFEIRAIQDPSLHLVVTLSVLDKERGDEEAQAA